MKMQKISFSKLVFVVFCCLLLTAFGSAVHADTISGTVKDSGGNGIANVYVSAFPERCGHNLPGATTDSNGSYTITGLDPGDYMVHADASFNSQASSVCQPYIDEYYDGGSGTNSCEAAAMVPSNSTGIDFTLADGYIISGNVKDTSSNNIDKAYMIFYTGKCNAPGTWRGGRPTNSNGNYCLTVAGGGIDYYVKSDVKVQSPPQNFVDEWYTGTGGTLDCNQAEAISVTSENVPGKDFVLEDGATISGYVYNSTGSVITGTSIQIGVVQDAGTPCQSNTWMGTAWSNDTTGYYEIVGLPPGDYYVRVSNTGGANYVSEWYTSGDPDPSNFNCSMASPGGKITLSAGGSASGINFKLDAGATISGIVYKNDGTTLLTGDVIQIHALLMSSACDPWPPQGSAGWAQTDSDDGTYTITGLPPGNFYLQSNNMNQANYLNEWHTGGAAPNQSDLNCMNAATLNLSPGGTLTDKDFALDDAVEINGYVYQIVGEFTTPIEGISVHATTGDPCGMWNSMGSATTDGSGAYSIKGLPAGAYYVGTNNMNQFNFVNEWWNGATDPSDFSCSLAAQPTFASGVATANFHLDQGAVITGAVKNSYGDPINDADIAVQAFVMPSSGACQSGQWASWTSTNFTGAYTLQGIPASSDIRFIYLQAINQGMSNYSNEWWNGDPSDPDCIDAVNLEFSAGDTVPDIDFWLDIPGSISGNVYSLDNDWPISGITIRVFSGPCWENQVGQVTTDDNGDYTVNGLTPGSYYVFADVGEGEFNYASKWYDGDEGTLMCSQAGEVEVESGSETSEIDFGLATGPIREDQFMVFVEQSGLLQVQFDVEERFQHQLKEAVLTLPAASEQDPDDTYIFDLITDKKSWTSECRASQWWQTKFGAVTANDYGEYTLTLGFDTDGDGNVDTTETGHRTLVEVTGLNPVTSVNVTINPGGGVDVNWTAPGTQTGKYYQIKIRSTDGTNEYYSSQFPIDTVLPFHISLADLGCLTIGGTYSWLVRVYDDQGDFQNRYVQTSVDHVYNPVSANVPRYINNEVSERTFNGHMNFQFDVAPGSRSKIVRARVYAPGVVPESTPNNQLYEFNLTNDWYDYSTATRILNGYQYQDAGAIMPNGDYTFVIKYDDNGDAVVDRTDTVLKNFTYAAVTPVAVATMRQVIHPDGTISFFWDLPVSGQTYDVRIRRLDGLKEYYRGTTGVDGTTVFANLNNVSAMQVGQQYQWFIRANMGSNTVQSSAITFLYDPFVEQNASEATFDANSAVLTNMYLAGTVGGRSNFAGYGNVAGATKYWLAEAVEEIDGVSCLKVRFQGNGNNPNPDLDSEAHVGWFAQDTDGNVWALQIYDTENNESFYFGKADAVLWMPAAPVVGQVFRQFLGMTTQVLKTGLNVPQLSTGLGPFTGCIQLLTLEAGEPGEGNLGYECPGYNTVKEAWVGETQATGWELQQIIRAEGARDELVADFGTSGLWRLDQPGGWSQLHPVVPDQIVTVDIDDDGLDELAATFPGSGLYTYDLQNDPANRWTPIHPLVPNAMIKLTTASPLIGAMVVFGPGPRLEGGSPSIQSPRHACGPWI